MDGGREGEREREREVPRWILVVDNVVYFPPFNFSPSLPLCLFTTAAFGMVWSGGNELRARFMDGTGKAAADTKSAGDEETVFKYIVQCASKQVGGMSGNERSEVRSGSSRLGLLVPVVGIL
jgi:hypothetical protein